MFHQKVVILINICQILKTRVATTSVTSIIIDIPRELNISKIQLELIDIGAEKNQTSKWCCQFDDINTFIFVASLTHYAEVLFEDETKNAMHQSLILLDEICSKKYFTKCVTAIVFLNKRDLFIQKLKEGIPLDVCFTDHSQWNKNNIWKGKELGLNYDPKKYENNLTKDKEYFGQCYDAAIKFISDEYSNVLKGHENIHIHFVLISTATERENLKNIFNYVKSGVIELIPLFPYLHCFFFHYQ